MLIIAMFPLLALAFWLGNPGIAEACCIQPSDGIIGWWPGDDASDISGHNHHATLMNGALTGVTGKVGAAFAFDGVDDVADTPVVLSAQGTLALWLNPASLDTIDGIIGTFGLSNGNDRLWVTVRGPDGGLGIGPDKIVVNTGSCCANEIVVDSPLTVGAWTYLALTFDYSNDVVTLYIDGQAVATSSEPRDEPTGTLMFGGLDSNFGQRFYFDGLLDDVTVYDRVLTAEEIQAVYQADSSGKCTQGSGDAGMPGDVNQSGDVTPADALCLFQKFLGMPSCLD